MCTLRYNVLTVYVMNVIPETYRGHYITYLHYYTNTCQGINGLFIEVFAIHSSVNDYRFMANENIFALICFTYLPKNQI